MPAWFAPTAIAACAFIVSLAVGCGVSALLFELRDNMRARRRLLELEAFDRERSLGL